MPVAGQVAEVEHTKQYLTTKAVAT
jgi:hypothetical protein